jgi:hypothetical protein
MKASVAGRPVMRIDSSGATVPASSATRTGTTRVSPRLSTTVTLVVPTILPLTARMRVV